LVQHLLVLLRVVGLSVLFERVLTFVQHELCLIDDEHLDGILVDHLVREKLDNGARCSHDNLLCDGQFVGLVVA